MIFLNHEVTLPTFKLNRKIIVGLLVIAALLVVVVGAAVINWQLSTNNLATKKSAASEEASESALSGSHNECESFACVAKNGIGPSDCVSNLDCQMVECSEVVSEPAKPQVGASGVSFTCRGITGNSSATVSQVSFKLEVPGGTFEEYQCPSEACTLLPSGSNYTAKLIYPKALQKGTYKIMTKTCYKLFSPNQICGDFKTPALN